MRENFRGRVEEVAGPQLEVAGPQLEVTIRPSDVAALGPDRILDRINIDLADMTINLMWRLARETVGARGPEEPEDAYRARIQEEYDGDEYYRV
jgi:hypothetical protein